MSKQTKAVGAGRREREWLDRFSRHIASGLSVKEFCERESISQWSFYQWRSRFRRRECEVAARVTAAPAKFIEVSALRPHVEARESAGRVRGSAQFEIKLELGDGVVLHVARF